MPQDNPRTETPRTENRNPDSLRSERTRAERFATTGAMNAPFGEMGARSMTAGLRLQKEMIDLLSEVSREWFERATSEAELAMRLPNKLTSARSVPDAFSAYQEWLNEWMGMFGEDSRRLMSDGRKFIDVSVRCFAETAPATAPAS
jgi:hypothetical protein